MTESEKNELLLALCGYLPYGVICKMSRENNMTPYIIEELTVDGFAAFVDTCSCSACTPFFVQPYLRPMSSMTEEEKIELCTTCYLPDKAETIGEKMHILKTNMNGYDWLNQHHFDYRGLIEKGLALNKRPPHSRAFKHE